MKNFVVAIAIAAIFVGATVAPASATKCSQLNVQQQRVGCIPQPPPSCPLFKKNCGETPNVHG